MGVRNDEHPRSLSKCLVHLYTWHGKGASGFFGTRRESLVNWPKIRISRMSRTARYPAAGAFEHVGQVSPPGTSSTRQVIVRQLAIAVDRHASCANTVRGRPGGLDPPRHAHVPPLVHPLHRHEDAGGDFDEAAREPWGLRPRSGPAREALPPRRGPARTGSEPPAMSRQQAVDPGRSSRPESRGAVAWVNSPNV